MDWTYFAATIGLIGLLIVTFLFGMRIGRLEKDIKQATPTGEQKKKGEKDGME